jgi:hypothetical protein
MVKKRKKPRTRGKKNKDEDGQEAAADSKLEQPVPEAAPNMAANPFNIYPDQAAPATPASESTPTPEVVEKPVGTAVVVDEKPKEEEIEYVPLRITLFCTISCTFTMRPNSRPLEVKGTLLHEFVVQEKCWPTPTTQTES